jgi:ribosomal protein L34E
LRRGCAGNINVTGSPDTAIRVYCAFAGLYCKGSVSAVFIANALGHSNRSGCVFSARTTEENITLTVHKANFLAFAHVKRITSSKRKRVSARGWAYNRRTTRRSIRRSPSGRTLFWR